MTSRRTRIVPKFVLGTAVASALPQLVACGGKTEDSSPGTGGSSGSQAGQAGQSGRAGASGASGNSGYSGGIIVLAIGAFGGNYTGGGPAYDAGVVSGGSAGEAGARPEAGSAGFWVLAIQAFGSGGNKF